MTLIFKNVKAFPVLLFSKKPATRSLKYWHLTNKNNVLGLLNCEILKLDVIKW